MPHGITATSYASSIFRCVGPAGVENNLVKLLMDLLNRGMRTGKYNKSLIRWLGVFVIFLPVFLGSVCFGQIKRAEEQVEKKKFKIVRLADGKVLRNVKAWKFDEIQAELWHDGGFNLIDMETLPAEVQAALRYSKEAADAEKTRLTAADAPGSRRPPAADMEEVQLKGKKISSGDHTVVEVAVKNAGKQKADAILEMLWFGRKGGVARLPITLDAGAFITLKLERHGVGRPEEFNYRLRPDGAWVVRILKPSDGTPVAVAASITDFEKVSEELPNLRWNAMKDQHFTD